MSRTALGLGLALTRRGGAAAWTPASLTNLVATVSPALSRSTGRLWQDAAKTVPALANNDPVRVAVCPFTGVEFTAPSDASRPLLLDEGGGKWSLSFDGADDGLTSTASAAGATTIAVRYTALASAGGRLVSSGTTNALIQPRRDDGVPFFVAGVVRGTVWSNDTGTHTTVARKAGGGGFWTLRADGVDLSVSGSVSTDFGTACLGREFGFYETFAGRVSSLLLAADNVSGATLAGMESYLSSTL